MHQHTAYVEEQLREIPALEAKTFVALATRDSEGQLPEAPWAIIYPVDGNDTRDRFTGPALRQHPRFIVHVVGASAKTAQEVMALVKAKFVVAGTPIEPTISDERSWGLQFTSPQPVQVDNDVTPPLIFATAEITWNADIITAS